MPGGDSYGGTSSGPAYASLLIGPLIFSFFLDW